MAIPPSSSAIVRPVTRKTPSPRPKTAAPAVISASTTRVEFHVRLGA